MPECCKQKYKTKLVEIEQNYKNKVSIGKIIILS